MRKRMISLLLAVVMIVGMIPLGTFTAFAEEATYTVTIVGENYSYFGLCGMICNSGASCTRPVGQGYNIVACYDTDSYKPEDLGDWEVQSDGMLLIFSMVGGAKGENITVTAPKLVDKGDKFKLTVDGAHYSCFLAEDLTEEDYFYFNPGEACKLTPDDDYKIYAYYDDGTYEPQDLGDWAIGTESGELYIELTAGEAGESATITAPTLTKKTDKFTVTVSGDNYTLFCVDDLTKYESYYLYSGESCEVTAGGKYIICAQYDGPYAVKDLGDWEIEPGITRKLYIELTAGESGESTTVTAPELTKTVAIAFANDGKYSDIKVTATDSNGTRVIPKDSGSGKYYYVCEGDTVNISAHFNSSQYYADVTGPVEKGWKIKGNYVECSFVAKDVSEGETFSFPILRYKGSYKVTIVGENYSAFDFCGVLCNSGTSLTRSADEGFDIAAKYNTAAYRYEELGDWIEDGGYLYYFSVGTVTEKDITITAPTLIPIIHTVTVNGENYTDFCVENLVKNEDCYLDPGESCEVTAGGKYRVYAHYEEPYAVKDLGDWAIDTESGTLYIELTAGEEGASTTVTAPTLIPKPFTVTVEGENYAKFIVVDQAKEIFYDLNPGQSCEITPGDDYQIHAYYDNNTYTFKDLGDWDVITKDNICKSFKAGKAGESTTITAPTLIPKPFTVTVEGENYFGFTVKDLSKEKSFDLLSGQSCEVTPGGEYKIYASYDNNAYTLEDLGDWVEDTNGNICKSFKAGEPCGSTTVTAPTLVSKRYKVTVQGENYFKFIVNDRVNEYHLSSGQSCFISADTPVAIYADYDEHFYGISDCGEGWQPKGGRVIYTFTTGGSVGEITVTAPELRKKCNIYLIYLSEKDNYDRIEVTVGDVVVDPVDLFGAHYAVLYGEKVTLKCFYNKGYSEDGCIIGNLPDGWQEIDTGDENSGMVQMEFVANEDNAITLPQLIKSPVTVSLTGTEKYNGCDITVTRGGFSYYIFSDQYGRYTFESDATFSIEAYFDSDLYEINNLPDGWVIESNGLVTYSAKPGEPCEISVAFPTLTEKPDPYAPVDNQHGNDGNEQQDNEPTGLGSVLSDGNWWIIIAVAVLALGGVAALFIVKKKKKPALAEGESKGEE